MTRYPPGMISALEKLGENAQNGNAEISGPAQADLDKFQAALADCR